MAIGLLPLQCEWRWKGISPAAGRAPGPRAEPAGTAAGDAPAGTAAGEAPWGATPGSR